MADTTRLSSGRGELERQGLVCIIAPDSTEGMSTLTKNRAGLVKMYAKGKQDAEALVAVDAKRQTR